MKVLRASRVVLCLAFSGWSGIVAAQTVTFGDPNLEAAVRSALSIPTDPITQSNLEQLVWLTASGANITNLSGVEWATNLTSLDLSGNRVSDLSPLSGLTRLTHFNAGDNLITNLSALSGLTAIAELWLYGNPLQNLEPITNLTRLTTLVL